MSRVAVTGGSGKLGRAVVRELLDHGWDVVNLDRVAPAERICPFVRVDLTDYGQTVGALTGVDDRYDRVDAVAHLAAVPAPGLVPNTAVFGNNILATHHVFSAARVAGIKNIVWASSETVLGLPFDTPPPYLPVDEEYPGRPESNYSLAKHLEEHLADQLCRWDPELKMVGLRFSNVMEVADYAAFPAFDADPRLRRWNLWSYIDARDGAQAVRKGLEYAGSGREVFVIASPDTVMSTPSTDLAAAEFPDVEIRGTLGTHESLMSTAKARRVLGYAPAHTWRDHVSDTTA
ncbi:NAD(P)-dependent oxidoreductase [Streptomyces sp. PT12]|uniref:NAD-dependent epimerase/dehydratase family protein n=1 Tax=Streptomyces sp. PT12 TaxID=1510197 RepID=UPI000DE4DDEC|nr:NAD(P)-dependent oxidoreductase [Streptomyces sp. PT12]RBM21938.1 UDP-glucose 4-epimerase [Streptomyces sp. PT12]